MEHINKRQELIPVETPRQAHKPNDIPDSWVLLHDRNDWQNEEWFQPEQGYQRDHEVPCQWENSQDHPIDQGLAGPQEW